MSSLKSKYLLDISQTVPSGDKTVKKKKTPKIKKKVKKNKLKSITSHVTDQQNSILRILSGKKRKVDDIVKRIKLIEGQASQMEVEDEDDEEKATSGDIVYGKEEWFNIIKSINLKVPLLSRRSKLTLSLITSMYLDENHDKSITLEETSFEEMGKIKDNMIGHIKKRKQSLWEAAATPPTERLSNDELCWLYDIGEEATEESLQKVDFDSSFTSEIQRENVLTLSQVLRDRSYNALEEVDFDSSLEIPNSSPEPEPLIFKSRAQEQEVDMFPLGQIGSLGSSSQYPILSIDSTPKEAFFSMPREISAPLQLDGKSQLNPIQLSSGSDASPEEKHSQPTKITKLMGIQVPKSFSELSTFHTGNSNLKLPNDIITSSPSYSPLRRGVQEYNVESSPIASGIDQLPEYISDGEGSEQESIYSTAKSQVIKTQKPVGKAMPDESISIERKYIEQKSEITVRGRLKQSKPHRVIFRKKPTDISIIEEDNESDDDVSIVTTRVLGVQERKLFVDEVPNSSDDDEDISIVQIIREIKNDGSTSLIEVPSSQKLLQSSPQEAQNYDFDKASAINSLSEKILDSVFEITSEVENSAAEDEELEDFSQLNTDELRKRLNAWGLKTAKSKAKMIETLSQASKMISQSQRSITGTQEPPENELEAKKHIFETITSLIKNNSKLYSEILLFKPLEIMYLVGCLKDQNIDIEEYLLREYCDASGVTVVGGDAVEKEVTQDQEDI